MKTLLMLSALAGLALGQTGPGFTLTTSPNPSTYGSPVTLTATVSQPSIQSILVHFQDGAPGGPELGTATITPGQVSVSIQVWTLAAGNHSLSWWALTEAGKLYSNTILQVVNRATTTTTIGSDRNPSTPCQKVTLTASVSPLGATGTVTFYDGQTNLGTAPLLATAGDFVLSTIATLTVSNLGAGTHSLTARYNGDTNNAPGTSTVLTQVVSQQSLSLSVSPGSSAPGLPVTLTAQASPAVANLTIAFYDGAASLGTRVTDANGVATLATSTLSVATHLLSASYAGGCGLIQSNTVSEPVAQTTVTTTLSSDRNPSSPCQAVTLKASVSPFDATGTVEFYEGSTKLGSATLGGKIGDFGNVIDNYATYAVASLNAGSHLLTARYLGDATHSPGTSRVWTQQVTPQTLALAVSPAGNPGQFTLTATAAPAVAGLAVTFTFDATNKIGTAVTDSGGMAQVTATLPVGSHTFGASYAGGCATVASNTVAQTVTPPSTPATITLTGPGNPLTVCQPVNLTATLTPSDAAGYITFYDGGKSGQILGSRPVSGGTVILAPAVALKAGVHQLLADFSPSDPAKYSSNSPGTLALTVYPAKTATALTVDPLRSTPGTPVRLTAALTYCSAPGETQTFQPAGTVTFADNSAAPPASLATSPLTAPAYTTSSLSTGAHRLTASYSGDPNYVTSTSDPVTASVGLAGTSTSLTVDLPASAYGQKVTLTAAVTPSGATGTVTFQDGSTPLGSQALSGGKAVFSTSTLPGGTHSLTATYNGDTSYAPSTSAPPVSQTVGVASTATTLSASASSASPGQSVTLTATVAPAAATGTVTFKDGATSLGSPALSGGQASITTPALAAGNHSFTASYGGDANYSASQSPSLAVPVGSALRISTPALSSAPPTRLPDASMSASYTQSFTAAGGTPPYSWTLVKNDLADLSITSTGVLSGTPRSVGTFGLTVQVQDSSSPRAQFQGDYQVSVNYPALPAISLKVGDQPQTPADQPVVQLTLLQGYAAALSGTVSLRFTPNAAGLPSGYTNPDVRFATGGTSTAVSIPAGATSISLPKIQVGSVAGTIGVTLDSLAPPGKSQALSFSGAAPAAQIALNPMKPLIASVKIASAGSGSFQVIVDAISTPRDLTLAELVFTPASGTALNGATSFTGDSGIKLAAPASDWFSSTKPAEGVANGGSFELTIPFTYSGDASALGNVTVTLTNSQGKSDPMSGGK